MPISTKQRGFTLIELMVIIALVAIMAGIAVPSFTQFVRNNRVTTQADEIHRFLQYARGEAVVRRREQMVTVTLQDPVKLKLELEHRVFETVPSLRFGHTLPQQDVNDIGFLANGTTDQNTKHKILVCTKEPSDTVRIIEIARSGRVSLKTLKDLKPEERSKVDVNDCKITN